MIKKAGKILAIIYHPVFYVWYWTLYTVLQSPNKNYYWIFSTVSLLTVIVPILAIYILYKDLNLHDREKRLLPLGITLMSYIACYFAVKWILKLKWDYQDLNIDFGLFPILIYCIIGIGGLWLINLKYKISLHATAIGALLHPLLFIQFLTFFNYHPHWIKVAVLVAILLLSVAVLFQRVYSGSHKKSEVVSGYFLGLFSTIIVAVVIMNFANF